MEPRERNAKADSGESLRAEVARAWRRAVLNGLVPGAALHELTVTDVDQRSRLHAAAAPVVAQLVDELSGTEFGVIVADRGARLIEVRSAQHRLITDLEERGIAVGRRFAEETAGNNSVGTAHELRAGVVVRGEEHFLEALRGYVCYGHPVINPLTRRVEGVVSIVSLAPGDNPLLAPYIARTAREVEHRLLRGARLRDQRMLAAFQVASARQQDPVLVLGPGMTLANTAAMEHLDQADHLRLRLLAEDTPMRPDRTHRIGLASGQAVDVELNPVPDAPGGVLMVLQPIAAQFRAAGTPVPAPSAVGAGRRLWPERSRRLLISGEPGAGKSTCLREMAGGDELDILHAGDILAENNAWQAGLGRLTTGSDGILAIEDVHLLDARSAQRLRSAIEAMTRRLAMTSAPVGELDATQAALAALCPDRIELAPLRDRRTELAALAAAMLDAAGADRSVRFTPMALEVLAGNAWPGNLRELSSVVREALRVRSAGDITPADLPPAYRISPRRRWMTPLERAEHDTILSVLRANDGNKAHTARELGISRTTLYNRLRTLRIPEF